MLDAVLKTMCDAGAGQGETVRAEAVRRRLEPYVVRARDGIVELRDLLTLAIEITSIVEDEKTYTGHRAAGSIYSHVHGKVENIVHLLATGPGEIASRVSDCSSCLESDLDETSKVWLDYLGEAECAAETLDAPRLATACAAIVRAVESLTIGTRAQVDDAECEPWTILCVEDDPVWVGAIERACDLIRMRSSFNLSVEICSDRESAQARIDAILRVTRGGGRKFERQGRPIVVLDFGIPRSAGEQSLPSREQGLELLRYLRSPRVNVPVVVLTTPPNFLDDHRNAANLGVSDYLLKGADAEEKLATALQGLLGRNSRRQLQVLESTGRLIRIDDVEINLDPHVFRTLCVITGEYPRAITAEYASSLLVRLGDTSSDVVEQSLRLNWVEARKQAGDCDGAVRWFMSSRFVLWKVVRAEACANGIAETDVSAVGRFLEAKYGAGSVRQPGAQNVEKNVYILRGEIKRAFNALQRTIFPEEEVIANTQVGNCFAYKIVAELVNDGDRRTSSSRPFRILVVENDVNGWQVPIVRLLQRLGYATASASSVEEAVNRLLETPPDLICLDMHLPETIEAFEKDPFDGVGDGGLRVLKAARDHLHHVQAIVLTDRAEVDSLRVQATQMGVRVCDFLPKASASGSGWEEQFILQVHRIEQETLRQAVLPLPRVHRLPYIHLWRDRRREGYAEAFDKPWKLSPNQYKLLWVLAENANRVVPTEVLMDKIYGNLNEQEALKQLVKNLRRRLARDSIGWFRLDCESQAKDVAEAIVANDAKAGYVLNARIVID